MRRRGYTVVYSTINAAEMDIVKKNKQTKEPHANITSLNFPFNVFAIIISCAS